MRFNKKSACRVIPRQLFFGFKAAFFALFFLTGTVVYAGIRIQSGDLTYLGVISITHSDGSCGETPNARGLGLAYNPSGNGGAGSFYITGRLFTDCLGEITKPGVGETATFIQDYTHALNNTLGTIGDCYNGCYIGGQLVYSNNLYVTGFSYYDGGYDATKSLWRRSTTISNNSGMVGPVPAGPGNQGMYNAYMDHIPSEYQPMLGGPAVIGGCCWSVISRTSLGPALYAINPESPGTVTPLVGYPDGHMTLNPPSTSGVVANFTTKISGVTFIEGSDSVLFVGNSGKGTYCYGIGYDPALDPVPAEPCIDPDGRGNHGAHAYPYVHYMWAYDVNDLAQVKAGVKQMWEVFPYATWELPELGNVGDEFSAIGMAFDPATRLLYILKSRETDGSAWPQIHVFQVAVSNTATAPESPRRLRIK